VLRRVNWLPGKMLLLCWSLMLRSHSAAAGLLLGSCTYTSFLRLTLNRSPIWTWLECFTAKAWASPLTLIAWAGSAVGHLSHGEGHAQQLACHPTGSGSGLLCFAVRLQCCCRRLPGACNQTYCTGCLCVCVCVSLQV
jgi:hypothetical protein